ncbi:DUF1990 domain-containing protein [Pilimelia terevasa]|uniref:DUF1990 domain-containing protein n=1 Tax=Pilimelia terevasa TaxID=53372 RepID=A0A8J3FH22_9ACTN|nr:DUF1990 domain-containing protein [Pilimelia terevasa]GGK27060.1 DUF1990 domain-containing protein [Pilimelia terevasa]
MRDLDRLAAAPLTYPERGATRGPLPPGYHHVDVSAAVGRGQAAFDRAAAGVLGWRMHRGAGLAVAASAPEAAPDVVVAVRIGWGPLAVTAPCRVVYRLDEPALRGFAYGTLPGHPECGEEAFLVHLLPDGRVRCTIRAFSRPATPLTRLGGPVARSVQAAVTRRYLRAVRRLAAGGPRPPARGS